jgi:hypothetical protein
MLSQLYFSRLSHLTLQFLNLLSVCSFLDHHISLSSPSVRLACPCSDSHLIRRLYACLSSVTRLDLRHSRGAALEALRLAPTIGLSDLPLPLLSQLHISSPDWPVVDSVLVSRQRIVAPRIASLLCVLPSAVLPRLSLGDLMALDFSSAIPHFVPSPAPYVSLSSFPTYQAALSRLTDFVWTPLDDVPPTYTFHSLPDLI